MPRVFTSLTLHRIRAYTFATLAHSLRIDRVLVMPVIHLVLSVATLLLLLIGPIILNAGMMEPAALTGLIAFLELRWVDQGKQLTLFG